jgi:hypothetical protein
MNSTQDAGTNAGQKASSEAEAPGAADYLDMELEDPDYDHEYDPDTPLKDYNEDYPDDDLIPALKKSTNGKEAVSSDDKEIKKLALREKLAQNGFALRTMLMDARIPTLGL